MMRYKDLPVSAGRLVMHCPADGSTFSATRGDYFWADPERVVECECGEPMELAVEERRMVPVGDGQVRLR